MKKFDIHLKDNDLAKICIIHDDIFKAIEEFENRISIPLNMEMDKRKMLIQYPDIKEYLENGKDEKIQKGSV